ncbi:hypothetical protein [Pseudomonas simiae]|uniref:hypothetical protein n=1 Tax=Pseudomonas simiae TaxID=321846 RepID=UPI0011B24B17|nr:hypothetical protein [Pseudomonas simiae]
MKASVTYLHLLRHTPFFTKLDDEQLKWVIKHSRECDAPAGTVIDSRAERVNPSSDHWILLDGSWQVQTKTFSFTAGNDDPGKWYQPSATDVGIPEPWRERFIKPVSGRLGLKLGFICTTYKNSSICGRGRTRT